MPVIGGLRVAIGLPFARALVIASTTCAAFTATASWIVLGLLYAGAFDEAPGFALRLFVKAVAFTVLSALGVAVVLLRGRADEVEAAREEPARAFGLHWELVPIVLVSALIFLPNLDRFPSAAPDELHHLIVARNLAMHGAYASGLAPDALIHFDHYDSVGPSVIAPVAASLRWFGVDVDSGRLPVAFFGIAFPVTLYFLFAGAWGRAAGAFASLVSLGAFGTVYLGRTLYGEVPALTFLVAGLVAWRHAIVRRSLAFASVAGLLFGLAVLTKSFIALCAVAFAAVLLYDCVTSRRIGWRVVAATAAAGIVPLAAWSFLRYLSRELVGDQPSMLVYYRHILLFGLEPILDHRAQLLVASPILLMSAILLILVVPRVFRAPADPALMAAFLSATLFAFWWIFFTPMHIPRYLWYSAAVAAAFGGAWLGSEIGTSRLRVPSRRRASSAVVALLLLIAYALPLARVATRVYGHDQTAPDRALVAFVQSLPADTPLATTYWPAERLINFATHRRVRLVEHGTQNESGAILIASDRTDAAHEGRGEILRLGHYRVYVPSHDKLAGLDGG